MKIKIERISGTASGYQFVFPHVRGEIEKRLFNKVLRAEIVKTLSDVTRNSVEETPEGSIYMDNKLAVFMMKDRSNITAIFSFGLDSDFPFKFEDIFIGQLESRINVLVLDIFL